MDLKRIKSNILTLVKKNKYLIFVLLAGLALLMIPGKSNREDKSSPIATQDKEIRQELDVSLAQVLSKINGAGDVQVFLTMAQGEETVFQTDIRTSQAQEGGSSQVDTVLITDGDRAQTGLIRQVNPPIYLGAIVLCQGADSPTVRFAIVDAVSKVTGLGADRISVLKMK